MLEKKIIRPGEGARLTCQVFRGGWRGYQGHTLVVRMPNTRFDTFRVADVVTEGIQGQPQLTFDSRDAAIAWKESHPEYADGNVGRVNREYMCIKIPLGDGSEAWLAESNFPTEGSQEGDRLVQLYPDYFRIKRLGFFNESLINKELNDEEINEIVYNDSLSDDEKCLRLFNRKFDGVFYCCSLPYTLRNIRQHELVEEILHRKFLTAPQNKSERELYLAMEREAIRLGVGVGTLFCQSSFDDPFNIAQSLYFYNKRKNVSPHTGWQYNTKLIEMAEDFYGRKGFLGFFKENYKETEVETGESWKIKTPGEYAYRIKVNFPNNKFNTFRWKLSKINPYGGGPSYQEACFLTKEDAEEFIRKHNLPEYEKWNGTTGPGYAYSARTNLTLIKVPLDDGSEVYVRKEAFPRIGIDDGAEDWGQNVTKQYPEYFKKLGFFSEDLNTTWDFYTEDMKLTEAYNVPHETFKRVIIKYVNENGYIKGGWNGRYMTPSPTVEEINTILRHTDNLTDYMCSPEEYTEFDTWVTNLSPDGPQADWMRKCIDSWNKTTNLESQDLRNLVSLVSYHDSNIKFQRHQQEVAERERRHQEYVDSEANTWVGNIGDTIEFRVAEAKISGYVNPPSYYANSYPIWKIVDTEGHTYSWGDTKDSVQIEPRMTIKGKVKDHTEFRGVKQTKIWKIEISTPSRLGFFKESIESDWLKHETRLTEDQLRELCDKNGEYELDPNDDCFGIVHPDEEHEETNIVNIFFDDCGIHEFENLKEVFDYYGEDGTKNWIKEFIKGVLDEHEDKFIEVGGEPKRKIGFFNEAINTNLNGQQVREIMENKNLTGDEKAERLFGRREDYIVKVQMGCLDYIPPREYLTPEYRDKSLNDLINIIHKLSVEVAQDTPNNPFSVCTVFGGGGALNTLEESYKKYVLSDNSYYRKKFTDKAEQAYAGWKYIKSSVSLFENLGFTEDPDNPLKRKLGFFKD